MSSAKWLSMYQSAFPTGLILSALTLAGLHRPIRRRAFDRCCGRRNCRQAPSRRGERDDLSLLEPAFLEVGAGAGAVEHDEAVVVRGDQQRMVPDVAGVVHALAAGGAEGAVARRLARVGADDHEPRRILQRMEQLAPERMALHQPDRDRTRPRLGNEQRDVDAATLGRDVDPGEPVDPLREALVDADARGAVERDDLAERREGGLGQRRDRDRAHRSRVTAPQCAARATMRATALAAASMPAASTSRCVTARSEVLSYGPIKIPSLASSRARSAAPMPAAPTSKNTMLVCGSSTVTPGMTLSRSASRRALSWSTRRRSILWSSA